MAGLTRRFLFAIPFAAVVLPKLGLAAPIKVPPPEFADERGPPILFVDSLTFPVYTLRVAQSKYEHEDFKPVTEGFKPGELQVATAGQGRRLSIQIQKAFEADAKDFTSVRDLYVEAFAHETVPDVARNKDALAIVVMRRANRIAALTRRGAGNYVLVPFNAKYADITPRLFKHGMTVVPSDALNDDEMLIMYNNTRGVMDGPFLAELRGDGSVRAVLMHNGETTLANHKDYGVLLRLT